MNTSNYMYSFAYFTVYTDICCCMPDNFKSRKPWCSIPSVVWCWSSFKSEVGFESVTHHRYTLEHKHLLFVQEIFCLNNRSQNNSSGILHKTARYFTEILPHNPYHLSHIRQNTSEHLATRKFFLKPAAQDHLKSWNSTLQEAAKDHDFPPVPWALHRPDHAAKSPIPGLHPCCSLTRTTGCQAFPFSFSPLTHSTIFPLLKVADLINREPHYQRSFCLGFLPNQ